MNTKDKIAKLKKLIDEDPGFAKVIVDTFIDKEPNKRRNNLHQPNRKRRIR